MFIYTVRYLPVTNCRGSRIKITRLRDNKSITLPFDCVYNQPVDQAIDYLNKHNDAPAYLKVEISKGDYDCDEKTGIYYIISDNYINLK